MEEKILIKSEPIKVWALRWFLWIAGLIALFFVLENIMSKHLPVVCPICLAPAIIVEVLYQILRRCEITVTDKRVFGIVAFGKRVDLPIDSVSSAGTGIFKAISVGTSSGRLSFCFVKNRDEIHSVLSRLLMERQQMGKNIDSNLATNTADQLKKYKDLLDSGVITQEEFDTKKKQLLGL